MRSALSRCNEPYQCLWQDSRIQQLLAVCRSYHRADHITLKEYETVHPHRLPNRVTVVSLYWPEWHARHIHRWCRCPTEEFVGDQVHYIGSLKIPPYLVISEPK